MDLVIREIYQMIARKLSYVFIIMIQIIVLLEELKFNSIIYTTRWSIMFKTTWRPIFSTNLFLISEAAVVNGWKKCVDIANQLSAVDHIIKVYAIL